MMFFKGHLTRTLFVHSLSTSQFVNIDDRGNLLQTSDPSLQESHDQFHLICSAARSLSVNWSRKRKALNLLAVYRVLWIGRIRSKGLPELSSWAHGTCNRKATVLGNYRRRREIMPSRRSSVVQRQGPKYTQKTNSVELHLATVASLLTGIARMWN
jgi:hypothetical protein